MRASQFALLQSPREPQGPSPFRNLKNSPLFIYDTCLFLFSPQRHAQKDTDHPLRLGRSQFRRTIVVPGFAFGDIDSFSTLSGAQEFVSVIKTLGLVFSVAGISGHGMDPFSLQEPRTTGLRRAEWSRTCDVHPSLLLSRWAVLATDRMDDVVDADLSSTPVYARKS